MKPAKSLLLSTVLLGLMSAPAMASRIDLSANVSSIPNQFSSQATLFVVVDNSRGTNRGLFAFNFPGTDCVSSGLPLDFSVTPELNNGTPTGAHLVNAKFAITCTMQGLQSAGQVQLTGIKISAGSKLVSAPISIQLDNGESVVATLYPVTPRARVTP